MLQSVEDENGDDFSYSIIKFITCIWQNACIMHGNWKSYSIIIVEAFALVAMCTCLTSAQRWPPWSFSRDCAKEKGERAAGTRSICCTWSQVETTNSHLGCSLLVLVNTTTHHTPRMGHNFNVYADWQEDPEEKRAKVALIAVPSMKCVVCCPGFSPTHLGGR